MEVTPRWVAPGVWRLGRAGDLAHHSYLLSLVGDSEPATAKGWVWVDPGDPERYPEIALQVEEIAGFEAVALVVATGLGESSVGALPRALEQAPDALLLTNQETWSFLSVTGLDDTRVRLVERFRPGLRMATTGGRLEVIVNPYGQFTGAILLFEPLSGCLLSGDLLAGEEVGWARSGLFAQPEDWPFVRRRQERRMPCNAALRWTLGRIRRLNGLHTVCPRSGPLLRGACLETFIDRLETLPVGADLLAGDDLERHGPDLVLDDR